MTEDSLAEAKSRSFSSAEEAVCSLAESITMRAEAEPDLVDAKTRIVASSRLISDAERRQDAEASSFFREHLERRE